MALAIGMFAILAFSDPGPVIALEKAPEERQGVSDCMRYNGAFMDQGWTTESQTEEFYAGLLEKMRLYQIHYQFIDCGYFDKNYMDGSMDTVDASMHEGNYRGLEAWIGYYSKNAPDIELIASVNGSSELHFAEDGSMTENIADYCELLLDMGIKGINLDFEPVRQEYREGYLKLINAIRQRVGPDVHLSICVPVLNEGFTVEDAHAYARAVDMLVVMDYDTYPISYDAESYINHVAWSAGNISGTVYGLPCEVLPVGPGYYDYDEHHREYENTYNHSAAIKRALEAGAVFAGSGMWWFRGMIENPGEEAAYLDNWVREEQPADKNNSG